MTDQTFDTDFSSVQIPRFPAVYTVKQTLTDEQKAQARENIGAVDTTTAENLQKNAAAAQSTADAAQKGAAAAQSAADAAQKDAAAAQSAADAAQKGATAAQSAADAAQKDATAAQSTADAAQKGAAAAQSAADAAQKDATAAQSAADAAQKDATAAQSMAEKGVSFHAQTLTAEQKAQARKNIGAAAPGEGGGGGGGAQPDWNAAEGEPGHVLNRTHWADGVETVEILPFTELTTDSPGEFNLMTPINILAGHRYKVNWNGVEYESDAFDAGSIQPELAGAVAMVNDGADLMTGAGAVFIILCVPGMGAEIMDTTGGSRLVLTITEVLENIHKLDNKYLDIDWLPKYTPAVKMFYGVLTGYDSFTSAKEWVRFPLPDNVNFAAGETYEIVLRGEKYICKCNSVTVEGYNLMWLGNNVQVGLGDTGEPFYWANIEGQFLQVERFDQNIEGGWEIEASITKCGTANKIPKELLPDSKIHTVSVKMTTDMEVFSINTTFEETMVKVLEPETLIQAKVFVYGSQEDEMPVAGFAFYASGIGIDGGDTYINFFTYPPASGVVEARFYSNGDFVYDAG